MIIVTGGAGFIGSNIVKALNERGREDILVVDDLKEGVKFRNIADCEIADYWDKDDFLAFIESGKSFPVAVDAIFHEGACSSTTEWDGNWSRSRPCRLATCSLRFSLNRPAPVMFPERRSPRLYP